MDIRDDYLYWTKTPEEVQKDLNTTLSGLTDKEALQRRERIQHTPSRLSQDLHLFFSQYKNPLSLLLIFALLFSSILGDLQESAVIFGILFLSSTLNFFQERKANKAAEKLRVLLQTKANVKRNNRISEISINDVVSGDIVVLEAGDIVPSDSLIIESRDLYVNEAVLTGESFPVEKQIGALPKDTPLGSKKNSVFKGTSIISGTATVIAIKTGKNSVLGEIESSIGAITKETAFEKGIRRFGYMLMRIALLLAGIIIIVTIWGGKNPFDSILFALALSVGLTPEMLPAIVTITLSAGAKRLSDKKVIVKKLSSIQNLGAMDILCTDKTGTLTEGAVKIHSFHSIDEKYDKLIEQYAVLNAYFETGYPNPMDIALRELSKINIAGFEKYDEVPYDFIRKRLSVVVSHDTSHIMITKGALNNVIEVCSQIRLGTGEICSISQYLNKIHSLFEKYSASGFRVIGIGYKNVTNDPVINKDDEINLIFMGFILLYDPPKKGIAEVISEFKIKKIRLKIITGDNTLIARNIAAQIGIPTSGIISGRELHSLNDEAIINKVDEIDIFSETEPSQKERIVRALQKKAHVVGYLGDGINDAPALKTADVGISVNNAVDVAKETADIILMEKELEVISEGITEGRKTYLNTLKYILITISANFGNMFSMAGASIFLPFLPLLPSQILLTNFLTDIPALSIASDKVDDELLQKPRRWNTNMIRKFMLVFGLESSFFDFIFFASLLWIFHASEEAFRTGWFVGSVITEILILLIIRTHRRFTKSKIGQTVVILINNGNYSRFDNSLYPGSISTWIRSGTCKNDFIYYLIISYLCLFW